MPGVLRISGTKANTERTKLMNMITFVEAKHINKVLVTELSQLRHDTLQVLEVIEENPSGFYIDPTCTR